MKGGKPGLFSRPLVAGIAGSIALFSVYFTTLTFANSLPHAIDTFLGLWYWMVPLVAGFGIQVGLYAHMRQAAKVRAANSSLAASSGMSGASMVACCAHHISDVLPLFGLAFLAALLVKYQPLFLLAGVLSNIVGISFMLKAMQKHSLHTSSGFLGRILSHDMEKIFEAVAGFSLVIFLSAIALSLSI